MLERTVTVKTIMTEVVILPGLDGTARLLDSFCLYLGKQGLHARAIAYPPDRPYGYAELEQFVRPQLPSSPFVLMGESFSGPLAIKMAADPPNGLKGLVLSTTFARSPVVGLSRLAPFMRFAPTRVPMSLLSWVLLGPWATPELRQELDTALRTLTPEVIRARVTAALRVDVSGLLPSVRVPVLQLVALQDRLLTPSAPRALSTALADCRTVRRPGPHLLLQTATQVCARDVGVFLQALGQK